jgi:hypothetical protein
MEDEGLYGDACLRMCNTYGRLPEMDGDSDAGSDAGSEAGSDGYWSGDPDSYSCDSDVDDTRLQPVRWRSQLTYDQIMQAHAASVYDEAHRCGYDSDARGGGAHLCDVGAAKQERVAPKTGVDCVICMDSRVAESVYCSRVCGTVYHAECLDRCSDSRCPTCRQVASFDACPAG